MARLFFKLWRGRYRRRLACSVCSLNCAILRKNTVKLFKQVIRSHINGLPLSGTVPTQIGLLTDLKSLLLYNLGLSGSLPTSLGQLSSLSTL
jgi:hypothetical protein